MRKLAEVRAPVPAMAVATAISAARGQPVSRPVLRDLRGNPDPTLRGLAWRAEARGGRAARDNERASEIEYRTAVADEDPGVRSEALLSAARTGQPWLLDHLRTVAAKPDLAQLNAYLLLATIGSAQDVPLLLSLSRGLGWERYRLLAACGRPEAVDELVAIMTAGPPVEGALAAVAFLRISGVDVSRPERVKLLAEGAEPDDFTDEIKVANPDRASAVWNQLRSSGGERWCRGAVFSSLSPEALPLELDFEARAGIQLAAFQSGQIAQVTFDDERFPFRA